MGLEWPMPGIAVFQATFFGGEIVHETGTAAALTPDASGPRNEGQFCALSPAPAATKPTQEKRRRGEKLLFLPFSPSPVGVCSERPIYFASAIANSWLRLTTKIVPLAGTGVE